MLKNKNQKTLPKKKILIGAAIAIIAVIVAVIAIMMANKEEKTKKLKRLSSVVPLWKPAKSLVFCPVTWLRRSTPTCAPYMTRSTN